MASRSPIRLMRFVFWLRLHGRISFLMAWYMKAMSSIITVRFRLATISVRYGTHRAVLRLSVPECRSSSQNIRNSLILSLKWVFILESGALISSRRKLWIMLPALPYSMMYPRVMHRQMKRLWHWVRQRASSSGTVWSWVPVLSQRMSCRIMQTWP